MKVPCNMLLPRRRSMFTRFPYRMCGTMSQHVTPIISCHHRLSISYQPLTVPQKIPSKPRIAVAEDHFPKTNPLVKWGSVLCRGVRGRAMQSTKSVGVVRQNAPRLSCSPATHRVGIEPPLTRKSSEKMRSGHMITCDVYFLCLPHILETKKTKSSFHLVKDLVTMIDYQTTTYDVNSL